MSDKMLDTSQLVNGVAILLSFYVGYKYGISNLQKKSKDDPGTASENKNSPTFVSIFSFELFIVFHWMHLLDFIFIRFVRHILLMRFKSFHRWVG